MSEFKIQKSPLPPKRKMIGEYNLISTPEPTSYPNTGTPTFNRRDKKSGSNHYRQFSDQQQQSPHYSQTQRHPSKDATQVMRDIMSEYVEESNKNYNREIPHYTFHHAGSPVPPSPAPFKFLAAPANAAAYLYSPNKQTKPLFHSASMGITGSKGSKYVEDDYLIHSSWAAPALAAAISPTDTKYSHQQAFGFPTDFNPRKAANMPHREKVDNWILAVPVYPNPLNSESWCNDCYSPAITITDDIIEDEDMIDDVYTTGNIKFGKPTTMLDFSNENEIIEYQSKMITVLVNRSYYNDPEKVRYGGLDSFGLSRSLLEDEDAEEVYDIDNNEESLDEIEGFATQKLNLIDGLN